LIHPEQIPELDLNILSRKSLIKLKYLPSLGIDEPRLLLSTEQLY